MQINYNFLTDIVDYKKWEINTFILSLSPSYGITYPQCRQRCVFFFRLKLQLKPTYQSTESVDSFAVLTFIGQKKTHLRWG